MSQTISYPAFSGYPNDWLSPTDRNLDTYSAGSAGTFTPFSCSAEHPTCAMPSHGNNVFTFPPKLKRLWRPCLTKRQNITITILGKYSIDHSSSPDSHLRRSPTLPSQVAPMTGFRQRIGISMPTVLVHAGILTPFPFIAPKPDRSVVTAKGPLCDLHIYYITHIGKLQ